MKDLESADDIRTILGDAASRSRRFFLPYRKIFILWGIIQIVAGCGSHLLLILGRDRWIAPLWLSLVAFGILASRLLSRRLQTRSGVKPALLGYFVPLWTGGSGVIVTFFILSAAFGSFEMQYLVALSLPVLALCSLVSGSLFRSRTLYALSAAFLAAAIPCAVFPEWALLVQAILLGGGLVLLGIKRDA